MKATKECKFLTATDIALLMEISQTTAYRLIKKLNNELKEQGKITIPGKVPKRYFDERTIL